MRAMERSGRAAIGRFVLSTKEHLVLLRAVDGGLAIETLYYPEDIRIGEQREIAERLAGVEVRDEELAIADQLIDSLTTDFDPGKYHNETRRALLEFLEAKADGQSPVIPEDVSEPAPVVDLMAALKASLAAGGTVAEEAAAAAETPAKATRAKATPAKRRATKKEQLSIDEAKLRRVEGDGATDDADGQAASGEQKQAPRRRRKRAS
jgi:DNA end-binding protein Ku